MTAGGGPLALEHRLLYSQCWEDVAVARAALRIRPRSTVLAIAAAGDNVLSVLQDDPARVLAIDVNPAQTALLQLKMAAIECLEGPAEVGRFLGAEPSADRRRAYERVRPALPAEAGGFWDANVELIEAGVIHAGRFERYLSLFRRGVLPLVPGRRVVREMLGATSLDDQRRIYRERWDSRRWRLLFRVFFSRHLLSRFGRDPAFFGNCEIEEIGAHYLDRAEHALTSIPIWRNPYLTYMLSGRFGAGEQMPDYLRPGAQSIARERLDRVEVRTGCLDDVLRTLPSDSVDAFYLSDVFELSTLAEHAATLAEVARVGRPGARICYWNNLVPRRRPESMAASLASDAIESDRLHRIDRAFLYSRLVIETVAGSAA